MDKVKGNIKHIWLFGIYGIIGSLYGVFNKPWNEVSNLTTIFDMKIPFLKIFIIPYYSWYVFLIVGVLFLMFNDKKSYYKAVYSLCIGVAICYVIYLLFQTTLARPVVVGNDFLSRLVRYTYQNDNPFNCFPSIHVYTTSVIGYFLLGLKNLKAYQKSMILTLVISIILSTLFVKQHLILDVISALGLGYFIINGINLLEERIGASKDEEREGTYS